MFLIDNELKHFALHFFLSFQLIFMKYLRIGIDFAANISRFRDMPHSKDLLLPTMRNNAELIWPGFAGIQSLKLCCQVA
jgi:hypothetical protein